MLLFIILGVAAAIALITYTILAQMDERSVVRSSLRQLDGYEVENVRDQDLLRPFAERALVPFVGGLTGIGRRFTPVGYVDNVRKKFTYAGQGSPEMIDRFLAIRVVTVALVPLWFLVVFVGGVGTGMLQLLLFGLGAMVLVLGPDARLSRRVQERQYQIQRALPDIMDLLTISVEAGLGFEQALDRVVDAVPGPLSEEFGRMLGEIRAGAARGEAMRSMEGRTDVAEVRSFVLAVLQADTFGVSIGRVLRAQADEMRIKRRQLAQEKAQKAPVKMLIPMVFCIFPALFVVIIGPAGISISENLGSK